MAAILFDLALLGLASCVMGAMYDPYYANMTWQPPRTLHADWSNLTVETQTGTFIGAFNDSYPNVRQFLRIPYAKPPVGSLRWLPPQRAERSNKMFDSTYYGPACPQYVSPDSSMWNEYEPGNVLASVGEKLNQGSVAWSSSEDCLSLAVWTPAQANKTSKLPVALFVTGGGGTTGGIWIPSQLPSQWVSRSQEHIVVTINYRVNIFGNPRSRALSEQSLALLDVRAAVEWVGKNIQAFGGDPHNIMLWGQSQGAALTHLYTLAFPNDPIVAKYGMISVPGPEPVIDLTTVDDVYADFDIVAKGLGCNYGNDSDAELECMRRISWVQIEEYINRYNGTPSISFGSYIPDERYVFSNETQRYLEGKVARGPAIRSNAAREHPSDNITDVNYQEGLSDCEAVKYIALRKSLGLETYRYYWAGNFSNISPVDWLGAFHWSDLLMIFGSYAIDVGTITQLEVDTSATMQDSILAFLKDSSTVSTTVGWPAFDASSADGGLILEFGNGVAVKNVTGDYIDGGCYNSTIGFRLNG
ncbi:Carboxylesterase family protein [Pleurostoma richardsiae]|uniref:Carboxylesterase family protein n=1 Tax=Pleurostoma richardsiae TaxID=41990 RepID=A0AA38VHC0_9PEZI|nr:Carboxylesterase family protein [Pleurostoma richardsiae]